MKESRKSWKSLVDRALFSKAIVILGVALVWLRVAALIGAENRALIGPLLGFLSMELTKARMS